MKIGVAEKYAPINIKGPMGQRYPYPSIWDKNVAANVHIYGVRSFFTTL